MRHYCLLALLFLLSPFSALGQIPISSLSDLELIGNDPGYPLDGDYQLTADIDASPTAAGTYNGGAGWDPIGDASNAFTGTFDGQGYTISNLFMDRGEDSGLFALLESGAVVRNLRLTDVDLTVDEQSGAVVGRAVNSTLEDLFVSGTINYLNDASAVGGIVGNGVTVSLTRSGVDIEISGSDGGLIGGMAGVIGTSSLISKCYAHGSLTSSISGSFYGGLAGASGGSTLRNSYSTVSVAGGNNIAGLTANATNGTIENSYAIGAVSGFSDLNGLSRLGTATASYWNTDIFPTSDTGEGRTTAQMTCDTVENTYVGWDFANVWDIHPAVNGGYPFLRWEGLSVPTGPIEIDTLAELSLIGVSPCYPLSGDYILTADIDASPTGTNGSPFWNGGAGWDPIGDASNAFTGTFDGQGFTISNLFMNRGTDSGFFSTLDGATVRDFNLANISIGLGRASGALAGSVANSTIEDIMITGSINFSPSSADVGGLAGFVSSSAISRCGVDLQIAGANSTAAGGLVARLEAGSIVAECFVDGDVNFSGGTGAGGLIGAAGNSTVVNSYVRAATTGGNFVAGFVASSSSIIENSYAIGSVSGSGNVNGFGLDNGGTATASYWNTDIFPTSAGGEGRTTEEMTHCPASNTYVGWDFNNVWAIHPNINGGYPYLRWQNLTPSGPIEIATFDELEQIGTLPCYPLDADYILTADIDASPTSAGTYNGGLGWLPINLFGGTFDGQGHTISNLFIDREAAFDVGLFGQLLAGAEIRNLTLENVDVTGIGRVGALLGSCLGEVTIENVNVTGAIDSSGFVGGLAGSARGSITNCHVNVTVTATLGFSGAVGGLAGDSDGVLVISDSSALGIVSDPDTGGVGGLVGNGDSNLTIQRSFSAADVTGNFNVGGLIGTETDAVVIDSYARGSVTSNGNTGGLIGNATAAQVTNAYAIGALSGVGLFGGLVALDNDAGAASITASYWNTESTGQTISAGGAGRDTTQMATTPYAAGTYDGWDFSTVWVADTAGENNGYPYLQWYTDRVTLEYLGGSEGTISGPANQTRLPRANGSPVTAVPNTGYSFVQWSDGVTDNPRTDLDVTSDLSVTAQFVINTYTLTYAAGVGGAVTGDLSQSVNHGASGTPVEAVPSPGFSFSSWSDLSLANPRTDSNVTGNISVTAFFRDAEAPTSSATTADATQVGGAITGEYTAVDNSSGVTTVRLYVKEPGGAWTLHSFPEGGTWSYTPSQSGDAADGLYRFATVATDAQFNAETIPTGNDPGDVAILYNDAANSAFSYAAIAPGTYTFPMTANSDVEITFTGTATGGPLTVSRSFGDNAPATDATAYQLADVQVIITPDASVAFDAADLRVEYEEAELSFVENMIDRAWADNGGAVAQYPATTNTDEDDITVNGLTGFSTWYFGNSAGLPVELDAFTVE